MTKSIICLLGPTASGKSAVALSMAKYFPIEIVSVDSALIYCGMDIGTAKPSCDEQKQVKHHLIDILDPSDAYSVAQFASDAHRICNDIFSRGKLPLLVGGTMLYFRALFQPLSALPAANNEIRADIDKQAKELGWPALHQQLAKIDIDSAQRIAANDTQRIQRALEVFLITGKTLTELINCSEKISHVETTGPDLHSSPYLIIKLFPSNRAWIHEKIEKRFDMMLAAGFLNEAAELHKNKQLNAHLPSMRCVGYRQAWQYFNGEYDMATFREKSIIATRQLCKRQLTWLRSMPADYEIDCLSANQVDQIKAIMEKTYYSFSS